MNSKAMAMAMMLAQMQEGVRLSGGYSRGDTSHRSTLTDKDRKSRKSKNKASSKSRKKNRRK